MGLRLNAVPPARGWHWIREGFGVWRRKPLAFIGLFAFFLLSFMLAATLLPMLGELLGLAMLPMLSLGFMIATLSVLRGGAVHPLQLVEGLRVKPTQQKRSQWVLCGLYALGSLLVISAADWVDGGQFEELQRLMMQRKPGEPSTELDQVMADPRLAGGMMVRVGLAALMSVPFWHAPALVHWGGQGPTQALFSSTLALWRTRGAFFVYALGWIGVLLLATAAMGLLTLLTGFTQLAGLMALPLAMALTAVFYTSLWFSFDDCFGPLAPADPGDAMPGPDPAAPR